MKTKEPGKTRFRTCVCKVFAFLPGISSSKHLPVQRRLARLTSTMPRTEVLVPAVCLPRTPPRTRFLPSSTSRQWRRDCQGHQACLVSLASDTLPIAKSSASDEQACSTSLWWHEPAFVQCSVVRTIITEPIQTPQICVGSHSATTIDGHRAWAPPSELPVAHLSLGRRRIRILIGVVGVL